MIAVTGIWLGILSFAKLPRPIWSRELFANLWRTTNGVTVIETVALKSDLRFTVVGANSSGEILPVTFLIASPFTSPDFEGFLCSYEINPLGIKGDVQAVNPLQAIRFALFQINIKLKYRFPEWTFYDDDGIATEFIYDDLQP